MARLMVVVEGATERQFVEEMLTPHLAGFGVFVASPRQLNGNVSIQRLARNLRPLIYYYDATTTLVDYYGFKDTDHHGWTDPKTLSALIHQAVGSPPSLIPYVQVHDFEALHFSGPEVIAHTLKRPETLPQLRQIVQAVETPEAINHHRDTAPAKRLEHLYGRAYNKVLHGPKIASLIGLSTMRQQCPLFHQWLTMLENLTK